MEAPLDAINYEIDRPKHLTIQINSIKKEFGDAFLSFVTLKNYLKKNNIQLDEQSPEFLHLLFDIRVKKQFQTLKQRLQVGLCQMQCLKLHYRGLRIPLDDYDT